MKIKILTVSTLIGLLLIPLTAFSHHNWLAQFDPDNVVVVNGTVARIQMGNPHTRLFVNEELENGETFSWNFEWLAASALLRMGIARDTYEPGDRVEIHAAVARNVANIANIEFVILFDAEGNEIHRYGGARE